MDEGYGSFCDELKSLFDKYFANRTLLVTIHQAIFPITQEVLHRVFSPYGSIQKIVPFPKSVGVQFLIEYQGYGAVAASRSLQRRNIYNNCCQLDILFWDDPGVTDDFERETLLEDLVDLKVFDKTVVRKVEAQDDEVKDGENISLDSGSSNTEFEDNPEKVEVIMEDESMDIVEGSHGADAVSRSLSPPSVAQLAVSHSTAYAPFKVCIQPIQVTFQPFPCLEHSPLLGSSNSNLNHVIEKPSWNLEGIVDSVTGIPINELNSNLVHSVKLKLNGNISKLNFARNVYSRATSIFYSNMVRRTPNEIDFGTVIDRLSGPYVLRDRLKEFIYELEGDQLGKIARVCLAKFIIANMFIVLDDPYRFRLLLMGGNNVVVNELIFAIHGINNTEYFERIIYVEGNVFEMCVNGVSCLARYIVESEQFAAHIYFFRIGQYNQWSNNKFQMQQVRDVIFASDANYGNNIERQRLRPDSKRLQDWRDYQGPEVVECVMKERIELKETDVSRTQFLHSSVEQIIDESVEPDDEEFSLSRKSLAGNNSAELGFTFGHLEYWKRGGHLTIKPIPSKNLPPDFDLSTCRSV
ncbi:hypothetical protein GQ457_04G014830 [Hibiscus cannabinus]